MLHEIRDKILQKIESCIVQEIFYRNVQNWGNRTYDGAYFISDFTSNGTPSFIVEETGSNQEPTVATRL